MSFFARKSTDMTEGNIAKHLVSFALPLLIGNLFQQLYNTVDTWVVGNYVSNEAYSAVGSVGPIINMLIGFFSGLASGAGVVISQYFGARDEKAVSRAVHTAMALTGILCVLLTGIGLFMISYVLNIMKTPDSVIPEAAEYLTIYFGGISGLLIYNMGAGILRAVGDSQRPFYFLVASALTNIVLDLVFVLGFDMGVSGVAWATIIAQAVSAVLVVITLLRSTGWIKLYIKRIAIDFSLLKKIVSVGIPAALQLAVTAFSNVFVMSYINYFKEDVMSAWTTYTKIDQFMFLPMQSISLSATTFVGQNLGAGKEDRARKGTTVSVFISLGLTAIIMIPVMVFAPQFSAFFNPKAEVVSYATTLLLTMSPFYLLCCINQVYSGALRGSGNSKIPMLSMLLSFVLFRQIYLYVMANYISNTLIPIAFGYPAGWFLCSLILFIYYRKVGFSKNKLLD